MERKVRVFFFTKKNFKIKEMSYTNLIFLKFSFNSNTQHILYLILNNLVKCQISCTQGVVKYLIINLFDFMLF